MKSNGGDKPAGGVRLGMIRRHRLQDRKGQSLVEFALVLPLLLLIVVGILEFGIAFRTFQVVTNAAREGARTAVLRTDLETVEGVVTDYVRSGGLDDGRSDFVILFECEDRPGSAPNPGGGPPCSTGQTARVQVEYPISFAVLGVLLDRVIGPPTVRSTSEMRTE